MLDILIYTLSITQIIFGGKYCINTINWPVTTEIIAYTNNRDTDLVICNKKKITKDILIHELAHIYHLHILPSEKREEWTAIYNESKASTWPLFRRGFVNFEATENEYEMFAETFVHIRNKWKDNKATLFIKNTINEKYN